MTTRNHRIRFCGNNLAAVAGSAVTGSGALAAFPVSNAALPQRHKLWKPKGNFTITTANRKFYIDTGSPITVTLTTGNYATGTDLAFHIQTALNAASSGWTCTYSTNTYLFTLGAGAGTRDVILTTTTDAVWDTIGFTSGIDMDLSSATAPGDEARVHSEEYLDVDLGSARAITFAALIGPIDEAFGLTSTATVTLMGNASASWSAPTLSVSITVESGGILKFLDDLADTTFRYWRLKIVDRTNPAGPSALKCAQFYLGDYETITTRNVAGGFTKTLLDPSEELVSENGVSYFLSRPKVLQFESVAIQYMDATSRRDLEQLFYDLGKTTPFYVSFDPTLIVSDELSELTRYVLLTGDSSFQHIKYDVYSLALGFKEVV